MSSRKRFILAAGVVVAAIAGLIGWSLAGSTAYYKTPTELTANPTDGNQRIRMAGKVVEGTIDRNGADTSFEVTDGKAAIKVNTGDVLPDTFGTGVEVVAEGAMTPAGVFSASTVLTKCPSKFKARSQQTA